MKKKVMLVLGTAVLMSALLFGCSGAETSKQPADGNSASVLEKESADTNTDTDTKSELADGIYTAEFQTDSGMFHVNEACDGKGTLTVKNGKMTIHVSLVSKNIMNLYPGLAEDAQKEGAELLMPTEDTVTYSDGTSEQVYGFDIPVPTLNEEFDLALIGKKGVWYDHKVSVANPQPIED